MNFSLVEVALSEEWDLALIYSYALMFFRQRSRFDLEAFLEENIAIIPKEQLYQMYVKATGKDHGFLFCDLMQSNPNKMFFSSFNARLLPVDKKNRDDMETEDEAPGIV